MTDWVRLWHDMPTDPKWRVIARKSGRSVSEVIAVFTFVMVNASANANERGRTHNLHADDIAAALDMDDAHVEAILTAMEGKVMADGVLLGWAKRQPKREDSSAERAKAWREERKRTQANASELPETETETEEEKEKKKEDAQERAADYAFDGRVIKLTFSDFRKWQKAYPDLDMRAVLQSRDDWLSTEGDDRARSNWFLPTSNYLASLQRKSTTATKQAAREREKLRL